MAINNSASGNFPSYLNISTTDNKGISEKSSSEEYSAISVIKNAQIIIGNNIYTKTEIISKEDHLTIAST